MEISIKIRRVRVILCFKSVIIRTYHYKNSLLSRDGVTYNKCESKTTVVSDIIYYRRALFITEAFSRNQLSRTDKRHRIGKRVNSNKRRSENRRSTDENRTLSQTSLRAHTSRKHFYVLPPPYPSSRVSRLTDNCLSDA